MKTISRYIMTLALLITAATGAWAGVTSVSVAGNWLNPQWDATTNQMAYKDGVYSITFSNMPAGQNYEFKFALNNSWDVSYGYSSTTAVELNKTLEIATQIGVDTNIKFNLAEACDVTISFNLTEPRTFMISTSGLVIGEDDKAPIKVAYNTAKTEASFKMPQYDVTATYTIKRDMSVDVSSEIAERIRIKKDGNDYQPVGADGNVDANAALPTVTDALDDANTSMTKETDYTLTLQKQGDTEDDWTDVTAYSVGNFRYKITGAGNYSGEIYTAAFTLFEGYEVEVAAGEYATFYKDEPLYVEDTDAQLYTITEVGEETATAEQVTTSAANMPILVKNNSTEKKTFLLIPTSEEADDIQAADEFKGTLVDKTFTADEMSSKDYYVCDGTKFIWVKDAGTVAANRAWLEISSTPMQARTIRIVFGDEVTEVKEVREVREADDNSFYDLNGRKLDKAPTRKGVYILNGKKVVVK